MIRIKIFRLFIWLLCLAIYTPQLMAQQIPHNDRQNLLGIGLLCDRGYRHSDGKCTAVEVPANAQLNALGNGWRCMRGYRRGYRETHGKCVAVQVPANAQLNALGNGWRCKFGFKRSGSVCEKMTASELAAYKKLLQELRNRRRRLMGSGNTYYNDRGARFAIAVDSADLDCSEGFSGSFDTCNVSVNYSINTDYNGNDDPSLSIKCEADISYTSKGGFGASTSEYESDSVYMSSQTYSDDMTIDFSFIYDEAARVRLTHVECEIEGVH